MRGLVFVLLALVWVMPVGAAELPGPEPLDDAACIGCHQETTVTWRAGPHGKADGAGCVSCHSELHDAVGSQARQEQSCVECHGGEHGAAAHSYRTSKHGVIATLEGAEWDWSQPLNDANYRAPTCAYCHMHDGTHGQMMSEDVLETSCMDCHSPRYVETLFASGRRTLAIGDLKLAEAEAAFGDNPEPKFIQMFETMQSKTMRNLRLGIGHQSPDYQWWYGHAALDGDLLRIKAAVSLDARKRALGEK
ncbi:MAG: hypothetical protein HOE26_11530 [Rhodospirillaceae bacterium]|jgi:hypothetical protein|nr:hypothetical protein [Rhodospirillaceae bacterium]MBT5014203.1 hypothetical protein [Rhodospirillaceae bacterium]MBT7357031.1 hypothetical protein [Rhodospirillaceae bacterium]